MDSILSTILYSTDPDSYEKIQGEATAFASLYIGRNIIQDDIFTVIKNYAETKNMPLEWIRLPINDNELCACTFIRGGRIFIMMNSNLPLSKQIFAAAHELYHIRCCLEERNTDLEQSGSILNLHTIDDGTTEREESEANAFAGALLAPANDLDEQIRIFRIDKNSIDMDDVLTLMNIFAIPYKAMVIRLMEASIISRDTASELIAVDADTINARIELSGKAKRWAKNPVDSGSLGSIIENLDANKRDENLPESRLTDDLNRVERIRRKYNID